MRRGLIILSVVGFACLAVAGGAQGMGLSHGQGALPLPTPWHNSTTLVTPSGQTVGGPWQTWLDESYVPTYHGTMVLDTSTADTQAYCQWTASVADACTASAAVSTCVAATCGLPETVMYGLGIVITNSTARDRLLYEQGHIIDYRETTDAERAYFMALWHMHGTVTDWWTGEAQFGTAGQPDPPGEWFAEGYRLCAENARWVTANAARTTFHTEYPAQLGTPWTVRAQRATCRLFDRIGES